MPRTIHQNFRGWASVPDGFKVVATLDAPIFHCASCNVAVVP
jgi:hypothetical protein